MVETTQPSPVSSRDRVFEDRPFADRLEILEIEPLARGGSGESFRIRDAGGDLLKLRICAGVDDATRCEISIRQLSALFPRFLGRDRHYLLSELVDGEMLEDRPDPPGYFAMGRLHALANQLRCPPGTDPDRRFELGLAGLTDRGVISTGERRRIDDTYRQLRGSLDFVPRWDLRDASLENFVARGEDVYYVDEQGIGRLAGMGLGRLFKESVPKLCLNASWARARLGRLIEGYRSVGETFPSPEDLLLVTLNDLLHRLRRFEPESAQDHRDLRFLRALVGLSDERRVLEACGFARWVMLA